MNQLVQTGTIQMAMVDHALQMKNLELDFTLKELKTSLNGLSIEGMTKEQVEELVNHQFLDFLMKNKKEACEVVSKQVVLAANKIMAGKTLKELLDWLKKFIHQ
uniref:Uncharacterized protein n=4 Tax=Rhodnius prolixus TaxID=13249 RepID=T1I819_RHOPR